MDSDDDDDDKDIHHCSESTRLLLTSTSDVETRKVIIVFSADVDVIDGEDDT